MILNKNKLAEIKKPTLINPQTLTTQGNSRSEKTHSSC